MNLPTGAFTDLSGNPFAGATDPDTIAFTTVNTNFSLACWINPNEINAIRSIAGTRRADQPGSFLRLQNEGVSCVHLQSPEGTKVLAAIEPVLADKWTHLSYTVDETNGVSCRLHSPPIKFS